MIEISFNDWSKDKLKKGIKSATSRTSKYGDVGDFFVVDLDGAYHEYKIIGVERKPLKKIAEKHYEEEGCSSRGEFKEVWEDITPREGIRSRPKGLDTFLRGNMIFSRGE